MNLRENRNLVALKDLLPLMRDHGVKDAWLFGSRARGSNQENSDWDLLVDFASPPGFDNFMGLKLSLEDHFNSRFDILSRSACPPRFLKAIEDELLHVA